MDDSDFKGRPDYPLEKMRGRNGDDDRPSGSRPTSQPPDRNEDAEVQLIGSLILDPTKISDVESLVTDEDFSSQLRRRTYETILHLFKEGVNIDLSSVTEAVQRRHGGEVPDDASYVLTEYTTEVASTENARHWAMLVKESALRYRLWQLGVWAANESHEMHRDPLELHETLLDGTYKLNNRIHPDRMADGEDVFDETLGEIKEASESEDGITGVATGYEGIDDMTGGPSREEYVIVAARPSMGKTAYMLSELRNRIFGPYDRHGPYSCAVFSAEMGRKQLATRLLSGQARVNVHELRKGKKVHTNTRKLESAAERLKEAPVWIDDTPSPSVSHIRARAHEIDTQHGLDVVYVDYLQLLKPPDRSVNREQQISMISSSLNALAQDLNCLVVALSQLNRAVEAEGGDNRPQLKHLRESGSLEQDADHVWFIYRAERYGILVDEQGNSTEGIAEVLLRKQRNGPVGTVDLSFVKEYGRFENLTEREAPERGTGEDAPF